MSTIITAISRARPAFTPASVNLLTRARQESLPAAQRSMNSRVVEQTHPSPLLNPIGRGSFSSGTYKTHLVQAQNRYLSSRSYQKQGGGIGNTLVGRNVIKRDKIGGNYYQIAVSLYCQQTPTPGIKKIVEIPARAEFSVKREVPLRKIAELFENQGIERPLVAIVGDTTKGKTEVAKQYMEDNRDKYHHMWFVPAENWEQSYRELARDWGLLSDDPTSIQDIETIVVQVHRVFSNQLTGNLSLIVFDDAPKDFLSESLEGKRPDNTHILITSQKDHLRMIKMITAEACRRETPLTICGEIASNTLFTPLLLGLGLRELSIAPRYLPMIKETVRKWSVIEAYELAEKALQFTDPKEISELLTKAKKK